MVSIIKKSSIDRIGKFYILSGERRIPEKIEITLYRISQKLVHNIIKHSQATKC